MRTNAKTKAQAEQEAQEIVDNWAAGALLTGWIPGSSILLGAGDMVMIRQVADAFGIGLFDENAVKAHLAGVLSAAVGGAVASEIGSFIPIIGWAVKSMVLAGKAKAVGLAAIEYFEELSPLSA